MAKELLTDTALRGIKPGDTRKRLSDGAGLYLLLFVKGGAHGWRLDYTHHGKRKTLSLGTYPTTGLAAARRKAEEARRLVRDGTDPSDVRKGIKAEHKRRDVAQAREAAGLPPLGSFEAVAREWLEKVHEPAVSPGYAKRSRIQLEADVFPWIGAGGQRDGASPVGADAQNRSPRALDTAHRVKQTCGLVFRYAIAIGQAERDPVPDLRGALAVPIKTHYAALTEPARVGELLRAIDGYEGQAGTDATKACFLSWVNARPAGWGSSEKTEALRQVQAWIDKNGDALFTWWHRATDDHKPNTALRAGFKRLVDDAGDPVKFDSATAFSDNRAPYSQRSSSEALVEYLMFPEAFKREICKGLDVRFVSKVLKDAGCLKHDAGHDTVKHRVPGVGRTRMYHVLPSVFASQAEED